MVTLDSKTTLRFAIFTVVLASLTNPPCDASIALKNEDNANSQVIQQTQTISNTIVSQQVAKGFEKIVNFRKPTKNLTCPFHGAKWPDPKNCSSYYKCYITNGKSTSTKKTCRKEKLFDANKGKCIAKDKAWCADKDAKKTKFECPFPYGTHPYPDDCSKHYLCLFSKSYIMTCSGKMLYDENKENCRKNSRVSCGSRYNPYEKTTVMTTSSSKATKEATKSTVTLTTSAPTFMSTSATPQENTSSESPSDSYVNWTPSNRETVSETYQETSTISGTSPFEESSPTKAEHTRRTYTVIEETTPLTVDDISTTKYNTLESTANTSTESVSAVTFDATSPDTTLYDETAPMRENVTMQLTSSTTQVSSSGASTKVFECPQVKGKFAHDEDCSMYFFCKQSIPVLSKCPEGTLFHADYKLCYSEQDVYCGTRKRPDEMSSTNSYTEAVPTSAFVCPKDKGKFAHDRNCSIYYFCRKSVPELSTCPPGTLFHADFKVCFNSEGVDCGIRWRPTTEMSSTNSYTEAVATSAFVCPKDKGKFAYDRDCGMYYFCRKSVPELSTCPPGTLFHADFKVCFNSEGVDCGIRWRPITGATSAELPGTDKPTKNITTTDSFYCPVPKGKFPNKSDCSKYYFCRNNDLEVRQCPPGTLFNTLYNLCYNEKETKCNN